MILHGDALTILPTLAAAKLGRKFIGIEPSAEYVEMSERRLAEPLQMELL